jgi:AcrR family transcriptional regulator
LQELILAEGQRLLAEVGYARFSAREVAKRIGYSIGTIYNVFGSHDALLTALNSRTFVLWMAVYDHRQPPDTELPEQYRLLRAGLTGIVEAEIARALPHLDRDAITALTRSLVATVHGHCAFALTGTFLLLGERDPRGAALARVREVLAANR